MAPSETSEINGASTPQTTKNVPAAQEPSSITETLNPTSTPASSSIEKTGEVTSPPVTTTESTAPKTESSESSKQEEAQPVEPTLPSSITTPSEKNMESSNTRIAESAPTTNGATKAPKQTTNASKDKPTKENAASTGAAVAASEAGNTEKLSGAELKKRAKAEKAARRAKEKEAKDNAAGNAGQGQSQPAGGKKGAKDGSNTGGNGEGGTGSKGSGHHKRTPSATSGKQLPFRSAGGGQHQQAGQEVTEKKNKVQEKRVAVFSHLYGQPRRDTIAGASKEVHPAVLALGLQMRDYVICGSNARCVAMLLTFKRVIESYVTPPFTSLARHLTTHLSHQISYLSTCRPLSVTQGAAIRALKLVISAIDPAVPENQAKEDLCDYIDNFIRERVTVADQVIASTAAQKIKDGDIILTYAKSSIVLQTFRLAHNQGKKFTVYIIDSRPLFEGKALARALAHSGIDVRYSLIHAVSHAARAATKVFLGAHAMMSNGRLYSRIGTAQVAMMANERSIPVIVCCESIKCSDRVALDSIVLNEIAPAEELVEPGSKARESLTDVIPLPDPADAKKDSNKKKQHQKHGGDNDDDENDDADGAENPLAKWKDVPNLQLLNLMYDVTPAEYIDMVITELGSLPPSAVPVVHRMGTSS